MEENYGEENAIKVVKVYDDGNEKYGRLKTATKDRIPSWKRQI